MSNYAVIYFGELRTFNKNVFSHHFILNKASKIIVSTWNHEKLDLDKLNTYKDVEVIKTEFKDSFFEKIDNVSIPEHVKGDNFGYKHYKAMLPKHYLMYKAYQFILNQKLSYDYLIVLRPDLFIYHPIDFHSCFNDSLINTKKLKEEFSDQFFIGPFQEALEILGLFDQLDLYWSRLKLEKKAIKTFINEGFLSYFIMVRGYKEKKIEKFFEINRKNLHFYKYLLNLFESLSIKNKTIGVLKRVNAWRSF